MCPTEVLLERVARGDPQVKKGREGLPTSLYGGAAATAKRIPTRVEKPAPNAYLLDILNPLWSINLIAIPRRLQREADARTEELALLLCPSRVLSQANSQMAVIRKR